MASSLFKNNKQQMNPAQGHADPYEMLEGIAIMMKGKDMNQVAANLANMNPQFRQFMQSVQGKTPEQFSREHGIDFDRIKRLMR